MQRSRPVLATNSGTDRAFNLGTFGAVLGTLSILGFLHHVSMLTVMDLVASVVLGVPVVAFVAAVGLGRWLGYAAEAENRSLRYGVWLNHESDE